MSPTLFTLLALGLGAEPALAPRPERPNIVLIYADDMGYGDLACYGHPKHKTPHLDRLAAEGTKFTSFYVAQAVCSASRAALLTGCYPNRIGILGALGPASRNGIADGELLISEMLKSRGYATAIYGKWHLGHHPRFLPMKHGFDDYFGLPYSNDMWPHHPTGKYPDLPLIEKDRVIAHNPDMNQLTTWYTERATAFIQAHRHEPFFLYLPQAMPHVPLGVSARQRGQSAGGLYGDVIEEIDWSVGQVLKTLRDCGLEQRTLVLFASDNGPWLSYGNHAGSSGPLREGKGTSFEGGVRVPCLARWPGQIPAGQVRHEPWMTIDLLPTLAALTGAELPRHPIDGKNAWPLLAGQPGAGSPQDAYFIYWGGELQAVRSGPWKLHFPHDYQHIEPPAGHDGKPGGVTRRRIELALYNLEQDLGEQNNLAERHPEVVARLKALADRARQDLGDTATKLKGSGIRPPGLVEAR